VECSAITIESLREAFVRFCGHYAQRLAGLLSQGSVKRGIAIPLPITYARRRTELYRLRRRPLLGPLARGAGSRAFPVGVWLPLVLRNNIETRAPSCRDINYACADGSTSAYS
jgi:hypothetical protein